MQAKQDSALERYFQLPFVIFGTRCRVTKVSRLALNICSVVVTGTSHLLLQPPKRPESQAAVPRVSRHQIRAHLSIPLMLSVLLCWSMGTKITVLARAVTHTLLWGPTAVAPKDPSAQW